MVVHVKRADGVNKVSIFFEKAIGQSREAAPHSSAHVEVLSFDVASGSFRRTEGIVFS